MFIAWYGHVIRRDESHITKRVMTKNVDGHPSRGRSRKRWIGCVQHDMKIKGVSMEMTSDRREWKKKTCCADPIWWDKGMMMMMIVVVVFVSW
jgi:hypothetical protein